MYSSAQTARWAVLLRGARVSLTLARMQVEDAVVMYDHDNRRPRGFGFLTYATQEGAAAMKAAASGQRLHGVQIEIQPAVLQDWVAPAAANGRG